MNDNVNVQPMTRRERRLLEERASQPVPTVNAAPAATSPTPLTPPPVVPAAVLPPPPAPLTRRERRALEGQESTPAEAATAEKSPPAMVSPDVGLTELLPPTRQVPAPAHHTGAPEPLPPVFGAPSSSRASDFSASRTVGSVSSATSSLILSDTPTIDMAGPLNNTGEVVVTGQIRLPSSLAARGGAPALVEDRDQDEVMDAYVTGAIAPTAKPMRASQAVSGKGDDTDIVLVRRARWGTATVVTVLVAGVLGFAALGLLVLAMLTGVLG